MRSLEEEANAPGNAGEDGGQDAPPMPRAHSAIISLHAVGAVEVRRPIMTQNHPAPPHPVIGVAGKIIAALRRWIRTMRGEPAPDETRGQNLPRNLG